MYCSRCGKKIEGACFKCREEILADLARRQAIPPGCPRLNGEFRELDTRGAFPIGPDSKTGLLRVIKPAVPLPDVPKRYVEVADED